MRDYHRVFLLMLDKNNNSSSYKIQYRMIEGKIMRGKIHY